METVLMIVGVIVALIIVLLLVVLVRAFAYKPPAAAADSSLSDWQPENMPQDVIERLQAAIRIPTISNSDYSVVDFAPFKQFKGYLTESFPLFHQETDLEVVNDYALIYRWRGKNEQLLPSAFLAHYDVVPVEPGTEGDWIQQPFSGALVDEVVWGRGTLDIKSQLTAYLEAAEQLMREGFQPERDLYFCFGHDEEVGGANGATKIVEHLTAKGIRLESVVDEGGLVITNAIKGIKPPLAMIGIAEKGHVDYIITVAGSGGHASMPPSHTALGMAARLVASIEDNPMPMRLTPPVESLLRNIAGEMGFAVRMAIANLWLFRPLLLSILSKNPVTNSLIRTTCAATMAQASNAANVLPQAATVTINVRLLPGDSAEDIRQHFEKLAIGVGIQSPKIELSKSNEASATSQIDTPFYRLLEQMVGEFYPSAIATPYLVMGGTDSRYYTGLSTQVYRFTPTHITNEERELVHNTNERLGVPNYFRMIEFFKRIFKEM
jgi:carboxypeptidase PM20D1